MTTPPLLTVDEAATLLRCRRTKVFELIAKGVLVKAPRFGKQTTVYAQSVFDLLEKSFDPPAPARRRRARSGRGRLADEITAWVADVRAR